MKKESCAPSVKSGNAQPPKTIKNIIYLKNIFFYIRLQNLYRLQKELREEKSGIINVFKESENVRRGRNIEKNVEQILTEMRKSRKQRDKSRKKKKLFKNKSDSLLDYNIPEESPDQIPKKTPEQNKSNLKRFEIHSIKKRKGERFLIKWEGYSDEENTWEHRSDIPQCVLKVV